MFRLCVVVVAIVMSAVLSADSLRCGRALVKAGDSANALLKKCGDPARKFTAKQTINEQGRQRQVGVSNWVYSRQGKKDMIVSVYNGEVFDIRSD